MSEFLRCFHDNSCCFRSVLGWCPDHCREFGCATNGDSVRHDDRRGQRGDRPTITLDNGKSIEVESLMAPDTRRKRKSATAVSDG